MNNQITFHDVFRYLSGLMDSEHQSELSMFVAAYALQRLRNYTSRFPESMSFGSKEIFCSEVCASLDFGSVVYFIKTYVHYRCNDFYPDSLLDACNWLNAYNLCQFNESVDLSFTLIPNQDL